MKKICNLHHADDIKELRSWIKGYVDKGKEGGGMLAAVIVNLREKIYVDNPAWVDDFDSAVRSEYGEDIQTTVMHIPQDPDLAGTVAPILNLNGLSSIFEAGNSRAVTEDVMDGDESGGSTNFNIDRTEEGGVYSWLGVGQFDHLWFAALGIKISPKELPTVYRNARDMSWDDFATWAMEVKQADAKYIPQLKKLWLLQKPINSVPLRDKKAWVYANFKYLIDSTLKGKARKQRFFKREHEVIDSETGEVINIKTQNVAPKNVMTNFIDFLDTKVRGQSIGSVTHYFGLNKIMNIFWNKKKTYWWANESAADIKSIELNEMVADFLIHQGVMIVGMSASDNGNLMGVDIQPAHVDVALNRDSVEAAMEKSSGTTFSAKFIKDFKDSKHRSIAIYYRELKKRVTSQHKKGKLSNEDRVTFNNFHTLLNLVAKDNFKKYLEQERKNGVAMSDTDIRLFIENASKIPRDSDGKQQYPIFKHVAGLIAKHEWYKAVRGNNYLNYSSLHTFNRMRLSVTDGFVAVGVGPTKHIIVDPETVDIYLYGEKVENFTTLKGLSNKKNLLDGLSMVSTALLNKTASVVGIEKTKGDQHEPREIKSVILNISEDGKSYVEIKHSEQEAYAAMQIVKKGKNRNDSDNVIAYSKIHGNDIILYAQGQKIDMISDTDGAKTFYGDVKLNQVFEVPEKGRRIIIAPHPTSAPTIYGPVQYLNALSVSGLSDADLDDFNDYANAFFEMLKEQAGKYLTTYINAAEDPDLLRAIVGHTYSEQSASRDNVKNKLLARDGWAIQHPDSLTPLRKMLLNSMILGGSMQARTFDNRVDGGILGTDSAGSDYFLKPYLGDEIKLVDENGNEDPDGVPEGVILSSGSKAIFNKMKNIMFNDMNEDNIRVDFEIDGSMMTGSGLDSYNRWWGQLDKNQRILHVNKWLTTNPQYVLTYRSPILKLDSVAPRKILKFTERDDGGAIYHHPQDVFIRLVGDFDIDEAGAMIVPSKYIDALWKFQFSQLYKDSKNASAELDPFAIDDAAPLSDHAGMLEDMVTTIAGHKSQGRMTNLKNLTTTIAYHVKRIVFETRTKDSSTPDGVVLTPKKRSDKSVMDYAPLKDNVNQETLNKVGWGGFTKIVEIDGVRYLQTTVEHELNLILNAAVDHPKLNLLTKAWKFNVEDIDGTTWILNRMFNIKGELTEAHIKVLRGGAAANKPNGLLSRFNLSNIRKGRNANYQTMSETGMFEAIKDLYEFLHSSIEEQAASLGTAEYKLSYANTLSAKFEMNELADDKKITFEEELAILQRTMMIEKYGPIAPVSPYNYDESRKEVAHYKARDAIKKFIKDKFPNITKAHYQAARQVARSFYIQFVKIIADKEHNANTIGRDAALLRLVEIEELKLLSLISKYESKDGKMIDSLQDSTRSIVTMLILGGVDARKNIQVLPFQEMLSDILMTEYGKIWEENFNSIERTEDMSEFLLMNIEAELEGLRDAGFTTIDLINKDIC